MWEAFLWVLVTPSAPKHIIKVYKLREDGRRFNLGIRNGDKILYLYRLSDLPLTKYRSRSPENPYIQGEYRTGVPLADQPLSEQVWLGNANNSQWRELKETIKAERGAKCQAC